MICQIICQTDFEVFLSAFWRDRIWPREDRISCEKKPQCGKHRLGNFFKKGYHIVKDFDFKKWL